MQTMVKRTRFEVPVDTLFGWHERPGAFERLTPPWESVSVVARHGGIRDGARVVLRAGRGLLSSRWTLEHRDYEFGRLFRDVMLVGPFPHWDHAHIFTEQPNDTSTLEDRIDYRLPLGALGQLLAGRFVRNKLDRLFEFRHRRTAEDLAAHQRYAEAPAMKVLMTGARGLVGSTLRPFLTTGGHEVVSLQRAAAGDAPWWNPESGAVDAASLRNSDALVHLAGENIAAGRWSTRRKAAIRNSRVEGTRRLCEFLARRDERPRVMIAASAIGFYGDRGDQLLDESDHGGVGFLSDVCRAWEDATAPLEAAGTRVVHLRIGVVLSPRGGALARMLFPFRMGLGGRIGHGRQYVSWIGIDDLIGAIHHCMVNDSLVGPVNATAPRPLTQREFARTLAHVLRRPARVPLPGSVARMLLGEMADALLLASTRVEPARLLESGYTFLHADLEATLRNLLGRPLAP
jgi:uncharacterized protein (TIGR01777 family)